VRPRIELSPSSVRLTGLSGAFSWTGEGLVGLGLAEDTWTGAVLALDPTPTPQVEVVTTTDATQVLGTPTGYVQIATDRGCRLVFRDESFQRTLERTSDLPACAARAALDGTFFLVSTAAGVEVERWSEREPAEPLARFSLDADVRQAEVTSLPGGAIAGVTWNGDALGAFRLTPGAPPEVTTALAPQTDPFLARPDPRGGGLVIARLRPDGRAVLERMTAGASLTLEPIVELPAAIGAVRDMALTDEEALLITDPDAVTVAPLTGGATQQLALAGSNRGAAVITRPGEPIAATLEATFDGGDARLFARPLICNR
jgi:hypothetical protein